MCVSKKQKQNRGKENKSKNKASHRKEVDAGFARLVQKTMPFGGVRTWMIVSNRLAVGFTQMPLWKWEEKIPWQVEHLHKGKHERYTLIKGWALVVKYVDGINLLIMLMDHPGCQTYLEVEPNIPHRVLLGPGAIISTVTYGSSVGNKKAGGEDWWPSKCIIDDLNDGNTSMIKNYVLARLREVGLS